MVICCWLKTSRFLIPAASPGHWVSFATRLDRKEDKQLEEGPKTNREQYYSHYAPGLHLPACRSKSARPPARPLASQPASQPASLPACHLVSQPANRAASQPPRQPRRLYLDDQRKLVAGEYEQQHRKLVIWLSRVLSEPNPFFFPGIATNLFTPAATNCVCLTGRTKGLRLTPLLLGIMRGKSLVFVS